MSAPFNNKALTTSVRRQRVPAGARGSRAAIRSHTLIFLKIKKGTKILVESKLKGTQERKEKAKSQAVNTAWLEFTGVR